MHHCLLFGKMTLGINLSDLQPAAPLHKCYSWKRLRCRCVRMNHNGRYCVQKSLEEEAEWNVLLFCANLLTLPIPWTLFKRNEFSAVHVSVIVMLQNMNLCTCFTSSGKGTELVCLNISIHSRKGGNPFLCGMPSILSGRLGNILWSLQRD